MDQSVREMLLRVDENQLPEREMKYGHSCHMDFVLDTKRLCESVNLAVKALLTLDFDTIAFRGMSGAMIAPPLALTLGKNMILVRKETDCSHTKNKNQVLVEGNKLVQRYVIVDDFQSTGNTARQIYFAIKEFAPNAVCLGVLPVRELRPSMWGNHWDFEAHGLEKIYGLNEARKTIALEMAAARERQMVTTSLMIDEMGGTDNGPVQTEALVSRVNRSVGLSAATKRKLRKAARSRIRESAMPRDTFNRAISPRQLRANL